MKIFPLRLIHGIPLIAVLWLPLADAGVQSPTARIVSAADTFLATLNDKQRQSVLYSFDDEQQRARWSNFPTGFVPRGGISLKDMTPPQRAAAMALVAAALSPRGFEKVQQIMQGDEVNKTLDAGGPPGGPGGPGGPPPGNGGPPPGSGFRGPPGGGPGGPGGADMFGKELYYIS